MRRSKAVAEDRRKQLHKNRVAMKATACPVARGEEDEQEEEEEEEEEEDRRRT